jgi:NiFe hydrogenase small subunit HydA
MCLSRFIQKQKKAGENMAISRRSFMKYCGLAAGALGLDSTGLGLLQKVLANPLAPSVIWLQGSACAGCSVSLLNRIADTGPATVTEVLTGAINLVYHTTLMVPAGDPAVAEMRRVYEGGNYVLVLEGGVPTAAGGAACIAHSLHGEEVTFQQAVQEMTARALATVCVGTCSSFGGIPASGSNPTGIVGVRQLTGRPTINISGCPANPDWVIWAVVQLLTGTPVDLDSDGRPTALYGTNLAGATAPATLHDKCPRNRDVNPNAPTAATSFDNCNGRCLLDLGCRGPVVKARCDGCWNTKATDPTNPPSERWRNWCVGANAPCQGCVEKTFPGPQSFFEYYEG